MPVVEIPAVNMISPVALKELMQNQSCRVFDTRTYPEYSSGSVPGALNLPLRFVERRQAEIPRNRMVVFLASDARELSQLYGLLIELGFDPANIRMLEGGIAAWKAAGFEVEEHDIPWC
ncbi:MAG: rhodanese-like domain-containing protein [Coriobacteriia bacterium]|nr:rhodanese-like domain-containing protein [Coriobacteriia bacterium]